MVDGPLLGSTIEVAVGPVAQGGMCVARVDGRVVFVRHTLPGERVRARVTEDRGGAFCRADAVEVLVASPDRVQPPCRYAGPGRCGGCDWQHATPAAQRELKAAVVREQFRRLAKLDVGALLSGVEELPGGPLGWRSRITYAVDRDGRPGLHRYRSEQVEHVDRCLLGADGVGDARLLAQQWPGRNAVEAVRDADGAITVVEHRASRAGRQARGRRPPDRVEVVDGAPRVRHVVRGREFRVAADGFWQVHPAVAEVLVDALLEAVRPRAGDKVLDLYAGAGLLTAALAEAVGPQGRVIGIESAAPAVADANENLADLLGAQVRLGRVDPTLLTGVQVAADIIVLDPPRAGAGAATMRALLAAAPRVVGYVSCDPATLARDVGAALESGWHLAGLRAFDAFPMTHHVECVATLLPGHEGAGAVASNP